MSDLKKTCLVCTNDQPAAAETCEHCGEASWDGAVGARVEVDEQDDRADAPAIPDAKPTSGKKKSKSAPPSGKDSP